MKERLVYFLFRRRTLFLAVVPVVLVFVAQPTVPRFWTGVPFVVAGQLIRIWSAGYLSKLEKLVTAGPFAFCRNPLYVGSFLVCIGYLFMCNRTDAWIATPVLFWLFHGGAVVYEEKLLLEKFGEPFENYCNVVPRFLPKWRGLPGLGRFSFQQLMLNNEYRGAAAAILLTGLFALMAYRPDVTPLSLMTR